MMPKFSVVIAVYNKEKYLSDTLESVIAQTFTDFEVIVVNDGSTDTSEAIIQRYTDPRVSYYTQTNQGAAAARNMAISKATAPYIALLDADDFWYPNHLETINILIEKYPNEYVFATALEFRKNGKVYPCNYSINRNTPIQTVNYFESSHQHSILHSSSTVLQKSVLDKTGGYNVTIKSGEDTDLYIRLGLQFNVVFSDTITARYHLEKDGLFSTVQDLADKASFEAYEALEKENQALHTFLDLNRYSLAIFAKRKGNLAAFRKYQSKISAANLNSKQRFLLQAPRFMVQLLFGIKTFLEKQGWYLSAFKG